MRTASNGEWISRVRRSRGAHILSGCRVELPLPASHSHLGVLESNVFNDVATGSSAVMTKSACPCNAVLAHRRVVSRRTVSTFKELLKEKK